MYRCISMGPFTRSIGLLTLSMVLFTLSTSSSAAGEPAPQGLDKVMAYAGTWKSEVRHLDTPYSKVGSESTTLKNDCWRSGGFFACNQIVDGDSKALVVFMYDAKTDRYTSYPIPTGGGEVHAGSLLIQGDTWIFPWDYTEAGKTTHFRVLNVWRSAGLIEFRQEYSADGSHWTLMSLGRESRVK